MFTRYITLITLFTVFLTACDSSDGKKQQYYQQSKSFFQQGNYDKAGMKLQSALEIDPGYIDAHMLFAKLKQRQQDYGEALRHYNKVLESSPDHIKALAQSSMILLLSGQTELAEKRINHAYEVNAKDADVLTAKANLLISLKNTLQAQMLIAEVLENTPGHIAANITQANLYAFDRKLDKALEQLKAGSRHHPENIDLLLMQAKYYAASKKDVEAAKVLKDILMLDPENIIYLKHLVRFQVSNDDVEAAVQSALNFIKNNPDNINAKILYVELILKQGKQDEALKHLDRYINDHPDVYDLQLFKAQYFISNKEFEAAKSIYKNIIEKEGEGRSGLQASNLLVRLYLSLNEVDEAKALLKQVLKAAPNNLDAKILRGSIALSEHDTVTAVSDFRAVLRDKPVDVKVLNLLARAYLLDNDVILAIESLKRIEKIQPDNIANRMRLAELLQNQQDIKGALTQTEQALALAPDNLEILQKNITLLIANEKWVLAEQRAQRLSADKGLAAKSAYLQGVIKQGQEQYEAAHKLFEQSLLRAPRVIEPIKAIIRNYLAQDKLKAAISWVNEHAKSAPNKGAIYNLLGELYLQDKAYAKAEVSFKRAIEINPEQWVCYRNLAAAQRERGNLQQAIQTLRQGIKAVHQGVALLRAELAVYYESNEQSELAIDEYQTILKANPDSDLAANNLAMLLLKYKAKKPESMQQALQLAKRLQQTGVGMMLDTAGWVYYHQQKYQEALPIMQQAVRKEPGQAVIHYHLGMVYKALDDTAQAKRSLQKALSLKQKFDGYQEAESVLQSLNKGRS